MFGRAGNISWNAILDVALLVILAGCAPLPNDFPREPSRALDIFQETKPGRALGADVARHPGMSGFSVLGSGLDAFVARMTPAGAAERTLDLPYYLFHDDRTGKMIRGGVFFRSRPLRA